MPDWRASAVLEGCRASASGDRRLPLLEQRLQPLLQRVALKAAVVVRQHPIQIVSGHQFLL